MRRRTIALLVSVAVLVTLGAGSIVSAGGYLQIRGSDTMVNLGQSWAEAYMDENPNDYIVVTGGGSGTGIAGIINNTTHIAEVSRAMTEGEIAQAEARGVSVYEFIVAQDGLAITVHRDNPVTQLTTDQLKDILTGAVDHWSHFGWEEGGRISVYSRQSNSGTYVYINTRIMDGEDWAPGARFMPGSASINEALLTDRSAIGYYGVGYVDGVTAVEIGLPGTGEFYTPLLKENIDSGLYPIARPLYFYTNGVPEGLMKSFIDFVLSEAGQSVVGEVGFYQIGSNYVEANAAVYAELGLARVGW